MLSFTTHVSNLAHPGSQVTVFKMTDVPMASLSSALSSQTLALGEPSSNPPAPNNDTFAHAQPPPPSAGPSDPNANPDAPVKRRPGRPKGSGKKPVDMNAQALKVKRPVGRPRKDGLPPGSVVDKKQRPRKRPPGSFATVPTGNGSSTSIISYGVRYASLRHRARV